MLAKTIGYWLIYVEVCLVLQFTRRLTYHHAHTMDTYGCLCYVHIGCNAA